MVNGEWLKDEVNENLSDGLHDLDFRLDYFARGENAGICQAGYIDLGVDVWKLGRG